MSSERKSTGLLILSVFFIVLFCILGSWQISRGLEKNRQANAYTKAQHQEATKIDLPLQPLLEWNHKEISLSGQYDEKYVFLLDNQVRNRQVGYNVLSVFHVSNGESHVLVDRGWIAAPSDRSQYPTISTSADKHITQGNVYVQSKAAFALGEIDEGEMQRWPRRIQFVDFEQLSAMSKYTLQPFVLRLAPDAPQGFQRDWQEYGFPASKHFGYAFQWFSLAITVFVLMIIYNRSQKND